MATVVANFPGQSTGPTGDPEELIGRLRTAGPGGVAVLLGEIPESQRVTLAAFCYGRSHLHEIGLAIAALCDFSALSHAPGFLGQHLFSLSRENTGLSATRKSYGRLPITLAKTAGRSFPIDETDEEAASRH
jgi:hypothetical protein